MELLALTPVHPRLRGELECRNWPYGWHCGSSPLTRGTPSPGTEYTGIGRFIPAYAGNSLGSMSGNGLQAVHPRLRGELNDGPDPVSNYTGSSPLTRGTPADDSFNPYVDRFIPAYAGNSHLENSLTRQSTVHPRLRGELSQNPEKFHW